MAPTESGYKLPFGFAQAAIQFKGAEKSVTFTDTGDLVGVTGHGYSNGDVVVFSTITTTTGVSTGTTYYVISANTDDFQVSTTSGGSAVTLTTNGTGVVAKYYEYRLRMAQRITNNVQASNTNYEGDNSIITVTNTQSMSFTFDSDCLPIAAHALLFGGAEVTSSLPDSYTSAYPLLPTNARSGVTAGFWGEGRVTSFSSAGVQTTRTARLWYPLGTVTTTQLPALVTSDKPPAFQYTFNVTNMAPSVDVMGRALPVTGSAVIYMDKAA